MYEVQTYKALRYLEMRYANGKGFYELNPFPGCNQLVVSNHAFVYRWERNKGEGIKQHQERLLEAFRLGYDAIICTVVATNEPQIKILRRFDWSKVFEFRNRETEKDIQVWCRSLTANIWCGNTTDVDC